MDHRAERPARAGWLIGRACRNRILEPAASACSYTLCAERGKVGIGYSYTLWQRGARQDFVVLGPCDHRDPRFVSLVSASERRA